MRTFNSQPHNYRPESYRDIPRHRSIVSIAYFFCKPDKSNGMVVMNKNDYTNEINKTLFNQTLFLFRGVPRNFKRGAAGPQFKT